MEKYKDKNETIEVRVEDLLSRMTLEEKLEQMHCYGCVYSIDEELEFIKNNENKIHSEFYTYKGVRTKDIFKLQKFMREKTRLGIPAYISTECVHGAPTPFTTIFPTNGCLAATFDLDLARREADFCGRELNELGFNRVYSPNVDLLRDGRWGRSGEDYSEDPYLNGLFGSEMVKGFQMHGVEATIKHYLAYSMPESGLNLAPAHLGEREIREYFLPPFEACIKAGAMGVMNCYNEVDGIPAGVDPFWMTKVLREEIGFKGDVITDYGLGGLAFNKHDICNRSEKTLGKIYLNANIDIEACGQDAYGPFMKEMVEDGTVDVELINKAVRRVLTNKFRLGLFDKNYDYEPIKEEEVRSKEASDLTYEIESKGAVLLKNNGILPLKKNSKILLVGPNSMIAQLGGIVYYSFADQEKFKDVTSSNLATKCHEAFIDKFGSDFVKVIPCSNFISVNYEQLKEARNLADNWADVIIFAGGNNAVGYSGGENGGLNNPLNLPDACTSNEGYDTDDISISESQKIIFNELKKSKTPIVFLIYEGKPCSLTDEIDDIDALMFCFGVGMEGNRAIADIISGDVIPSGKLTFTIPRNVGQIPQFYNGKPLKGLYDNHGSKTKGGQDYVFSPNKPLFSFGDGLSYTTFEYSNLCVNKNNDKYDVQITVKNTGSYDAYETVLLYTRSLSNYMVTPVVKKLRKFEKIYLKKGESRVVKFALTKEDFMYVGIDMKWTVPENKVKVIIKDLEQVFNL